MKERKPTEQNQVTDPDDKGGMPYDGTVDIEEVIIDDELYEINEAD